MSPRFRNIVVFRDLRLGKEKRVIDHSESAKSDRISNDSNNSLGGNR